MGQFTASPDVMVRAVDDMVAARSGIDRQISSIAGAAEGTVGVWRGSGGDMLRGLMIRYDGHARALQQAIDAFHQMLAEQAQAYLRADAEVTGGLSGAGSSLQM